MGGDTLSAVGRRLVAFSGPIAEVALISLCRIASSALGLAEHLERHPSEAAGMGSMQWAGLLAWPAAVLSAAPELLPLADPVTHGGLLDAACTVVCVYRGVSSKQGGGAEAAAEAHLPAIFCL